MDRELKIFIENNFDFLVNLYNRYIRYLLRKSLIVEYYASPYMNLKGYPSPIFVNFCQKYYNKKNNVDSQYNHLKINFIKNIFFYFKLLFLFFFSFLFFSKNIKSNSVVIHGFHNNSNFEFNPYTTIKSPPFEYLQNKNIYHDINLSFVSFKGLFRYRKNSIIFSLRYLSSRDFFKLHLTAYKVFIQNRKINISSISYVDILFTLVKGTSIASLINSLDKESIYLNMWENRGHQLITDFLIEDKKKSLFLDLGITFRLAPEYMMFNYLRHDLKSKFLFMSDFNYNLLKKNLGNIDYQLFENYRIDCKNYNSQSEKNRILLISPLSMDVSFRLYQLILDNKELDIKIRLHPYLNRDKFDNKHIEHRDIYKSLDDYDTIVYAGVTTASIELYFQGKKVYKFVSDEFIDIDPLVDNNLVKKIKSLNDIGSETKVYTEDEKNYYLGCNNKKLKEILEKLN